MDCIHRDFQHEESELWFLGEQQMFYKLLQPERISDLLQMITILTPVS